MSIRQLVVASVVATALYFSVVAPSPAAGPRSPMASPDFTQGEKIPAGAEHDWNLGAAGAVGGIYQELSYAEIENAADTAGLRGIGDP